MSNSKEKKLIIISSFEDASILRKFTILFLLASIVPMALLYYVFEQFRTTGHIDISSAGFTAAMIFTVLGVLIGYASIRAMLVKIIEISKENRKTIQKFLSTETIEEIDKEENEIFVLSRSFSTITKQLEENIQSLQLAKKNLISVMTKVGEGISHMENIDTFLQLIVETMTNALNGQVGTLMVIHDTKTELMIKTVYGVDHDPQKPASIKLFEGSPLTKMIKEKRPQVVSGIFLQNPHNPKLNAFFAGSMLCAPLVYRDRVNGIMTLSRGEDYNGEFSQEDTNLLFNLASQTAVAFENSKLNIDIEKTYFETISALAMAVDARDKYSRGHVDRVTDYALLIGKRLGLDVNELKILRDGARMHDLGKIGIPDEILKKEGPLTPEEIIIMRRHVEIGESIIKPVRSLAPLCDLVRHHHEKLNGSGYPDGLKGEEISPLVRILTITDIYDALTTERPYRPKLDSKEAAQILRSMKNELDQDIVELFLEALEVRS